MDSLSPDRLRAYLTASEPPCLSLYQPTHRSRPDKQQDPIRYANLVDRLEADARRRLGASEVESLMAPFRALLDNKTFWDDTKDGLAILASSQRFDVYRLPHPLPELAVVADSFHLKPLLRHARPTTRYQLLGITRGRVFLYEGDRDELAKVPWAEGFPATIDEALGSDQPDQKMARNDRGGGPFGVSNRQGHHSNLDDVDFDIRRFFNVIDKELVKRHPAGAGVPLIIAALAEHHAVFRDVSDNPRLLDEGVTGDPEALGLDELRKRAWAVIEPREWARIHDLGEKFGAAAAHGRGSEAPADIAEAAVRGRIATLMIAAEANLPGRLDAVSGTIGPPDPDADDVIDDLAEQALLHGGEVIVLAADQMPSKTGLAALYRF